MMKKSTVLNKKNIVSSILLIILLIFLWPIIRNIKKFYIGCQSNQVVQIESGRLNCIEISDLLTVPITNEDIIQSTESGSLNKDSKTTPPIPRNTNGSFTLTQIYDWVNSLGHITDDKSVHKEHLENQGSLDFDWGDNEISDKLTINDYGTVEWNSLSDYPSSCPSGQAVQQIGDTITCISVNPSPVYGEIYAFENSDATSMGTTGTWYQYTGFAYNGESNGLIPDHTNDRITISTDGAYFVTASISFNGSANHNYEVQFFKNNGVTAFENLHAERTIGTGGDIGSVSISGIVSLSANDTLELWIRDNSIPAADATLRDVSVSVYKVD